MAKLKRLAPVVMLTVAASIAGAAPAGAQPDCQFGAGLGPNTACGSAPQDDFTDLVPFYGPRRGYGYGNGGFLGGMYGDSALPGISAGPG
ncbi:hypothetical protein [Mycolicibacterium aubagnense]|uniref:Keratin associated protein n=1 Tax=Mycolicibacterium aubagnense TaxID=319707 RepID=A0ABN5YRN2_9MYCO|nr:hypothetical protein [Mycolicibacterium aubagnense]WGI33921.1 hypothetical protein QDT91_06085 [Mycolicibacterium aubagnense]BBX84303.1 hypothetical protein MAUB_21760 [Mycolicibacterium aubagnense]